MWPFMESAIERGLEDGQDTIRGRSAAADFITICMVEVAGRLRLGEFAGSEPPRRVRQIEKPRIEPALGELLRFDRAQRREDSSIRCTASA